MVEVTIKVEGMKCGMCEAHINDTVRKTAQDAAKVRSSHRKGETVFIAEEGSVDAVRAAIEAQGYRVRSVETRPYIRRGFFAKIFKK